MPPFEYQAEPVSMKLLSGHQSTRYFQTNCRYEFRKLYPWAVAQGSSTFSPRIEPSIVPLFRSGRGPARTLRNSSDWDAPVGRLLGTLVLHCEGFEHQSKSGCQDGSAMDRLSNRHKTTADTPSANRVPRSSSSATTVHHVARQWYQQTVLGITSFLAPIHWETLDTCIDRLCRNRMSRGS